MREYEYKSIFEGRADVRYTEPRDDSKCLTCKYRSCADDYYCQQIIYKYKNAYKKLENYAYDSLKRFGNTIISKEDYEALGERAIVEDLELNGFKDIKLQVAGSVMISVSRR